MDETDIVEAGVRDLACVRQFLEWFPNSEHAVVEGKRESHDEGWVLVSEWISRAQLYDRYVLWLVVAIDVTDCGAVTATEPHQLFLVHIEEIEKSRDEIDGPKWNLSFGEADSEDWEELVKSGGDFNSLGLELIVDQPVDRFDTFWNDTRPHHVKLAPNAISFKAPLRFLG